MKTAAAVTLAWVCVSQIPLTHAARLNQTPMSHVVELLLDLSIRVEIDGRTEQKAYDKYACWCEETLARKAVEIAEEKEQIKATQTLIQELMGDLGALGASIEALKKDIAENLESQREAADLRDKEFGEYNEEKLETEECIGGLEAAIRVLTGAGTGKKGFLEVFQEAQVLGVVAGLRKVLRNTIAEQAVSSSEFQAMKSFVDHPDGFAGSRSVSAVQIANNPFGDYAPQSSQIQGILKGMYEAFTTSLEKANGEEADKQKAFEELMATNNKELETMELSLEKEELDQSDKRKKLADAKVDLDDTKAQLNADEFFFCRDQDFMQDQSPGVVGALTSENGGIEWDSHGHKTSQQRDLGSSVQQSNDNIVAAHVRQAWSFTGIRETQIPRSLNGRKGACSTGCKSPDRWCTG